MKNNEKQSELVNQAKELIKPRKTEDVFAANAEVEALCGEYGSGTDCRIGNSSINPNEDSLLF